MQAAIGSFRLDVTGLPHNKITRKTAARKHSHNVVGGEPISEFIGPDNTKITITAEVFPLDLHPTAPALLAALRQSIRTGQSHMFVLTSGAVIGRVELDDLGETETHHTPDGQAQFIDTTLTLKSVGGRTGIGFDGLLSLF